MSVPKNRRQESKFEAFHSFYKLRDEVTRLLFNNFGFSVEKYEKQIEHFRETYKDNPNVDEIVAKIKSKCDAFNQWYIEKERDVILELVRNIGKEFSIGNSIFPSDTPARMEEYKERRLHMDNAIAYCFALKQEIQDVIRILPVDLNKYKRFAEMIDAQIALYKGVRQSDNRFLRSKKSKKGNPQESG